MGPAVTASQPDTGLILGFFTSISTETKMTEAARSLSPSSAPRLKIKPSQTKKQPLRDSRKPIQPADYSSLAEAMVPDTPQEGASPAPPSPSGEIPPAAHSGKQREGCWGPSTRHRMDEIITNPQTATK